MEQLMKVVVLFRQFNKFWMQDAEDWEKFIASYKPETSILESARSKLISISAFNSLVDTQHTLTAQLYLKELWKEV